MVSMLYIKSVNTLNHNTTFASSYRSILLISNNSNWIGLPWVLNFYGVGKDGTYTNPKELKGRLLFTGDTFFIFQNFTLKIKFIFLLKLINKSHNICHLSLSHNTPCLPLNLCISSVFYWVVFHWSQEKLQTMLIQNFGGQTRCIIYRRSENGKLVWVKCKVQSRHYGILFMKTFYNVVNSIICCAKKGFHWSSWILNKCNLSCKLWNLHSCILFAVCMIKTVSHSTVTSDLMYKKYKRLVYVPPDLLARFCTVNVSNAKNSAWFCFPRICFPGLIFCDQEPLGLMWSKMIAFLGGAHIYKAIINLRPYKICATLGLFANYFSLKSLLPFPLKVKWMCPKVNWFVDYKFIVWLNNKFSNKCFVFSPG